MRRWMVRVTVAVCAVLAAGAASADALRDRARALFGTPPAEAVSPDHPATPEKIDLGRKLYYDTRFSRSGTISCNSCHPLDRYGADGEKTSLGHAGERGARNSPSVYNAAFQLAQFWDGRAPDVEAQAKGPILNPVEMGMASDADVLTVLRSIPGYPPLFAAAFPGEADPVTYDNMARAIGAFERRLVTPAPFDRWLAGDDAALSDAQKQGLETFVATGCPACHNGPLFGGNSYQKLGVMEPYPTPDRGRAEVTGDKAQEHWFKVPSLRNVVKTGPWFHDGSLDSLDMTVRVMARFQLGKTLTDAEAASITTFLGALVGEIPESYIARPELPPSGPETPQPDPR